MKKFNESIQIEVSVDTIATMLLNNMIPDFKHRELVVESTIGRMLSADKNGLSKLFNSLNGYVDILDFKVGDVVRPKDLQHYGYWTPESIEKKDTVYKLIGEATVIEVNPSADNTLLVQYMVPLKTDGIMKPREAWIHHSKCSHIVLDPKDV